MARPTSRQKKLKKRKNRLRAWWLPCAPSNRGVWSITGGTGDYASLRGSGQLVGTYFPAACEDGGVEDVYTGHASS